MDRKPAPRSERRRLTPRRSDRATADGRRQRQAGDRRRAVAEAFVAMRAETLSLVIDGATPRAT